MARPGPGDEDEATLISPVPAADVLYGEDDVLALGERRAANTWMITAGIAALIAALIVVAMIRRPGHHAAVPLPSALPSQSSAPSPLGPVIGSRIDLGQTSAVDLAMSHGLLYILGEDPPRLGQVDARTGRLNRQVAAPTGTKHVVADPSGQQLWLTADDIAYSYDAATLTPLGQVHLNRPVLVAGALDGRLYLSTDHGIYVTSAQGSAATLLPGFGGQVEQVLAADPLRHRLLAVDVNYRLLVVTSRGVHVVRQMPTPLPESIVITGKGIWSVGFGAVDGPRTGRIDPLTLALMPIGPGDADAPQGSQGWAGQDVFWVKYNGFDSMTCRDARTGTVIRTYLADGPVVSMRGAAYAVHSTTVVRLPTNGRCTG